MIRLALVAALAGSLAAPLLSAAPARAQAAAERSSARPSASLLWPPINRSVIVDYIEPVHPSFLDVDSADPRYAALEEDYRQLNDVRTKLKKRRLLEEFGSFLAPLRLSGSLRLIAKECNSLNAYYSNYDRAIYLCYEIVRAIARNAPKATTPQGITRGDAIVGGVLTVLLHEAGHALYNLLHIPVLGREEDAADQIAAYVMLQFGRDVARTTIKGAAWMWRSQDWTKQNQQLSGDHSPPQQRFLAFLCMAYGADPEGFKDFLEFGWLPPQRSAGCAREYAQADLAFRKTVLPHVDRDVMKQVLARPWIRRDDLE